MNLMGMSHWSRKDKLLLIERLEMYVSAGMTIDRALVAAGEGLRAGQKRCLSCAVESVRSGQTLSSALSREISLPPAIVGLLSCGESSGKFDLALTSAQALMEREDELVKKCASAMVYPCVIGGAAVVLTIGLVRGVMPQIIPLLLGLHADLPILTRIVIAASADLTAYGAYALLGSVAVAFIAARSYRRSASIRLFTHRAILIIPIIGSLAERYGLAVFFQSLGALVESGMPADVAFARCADTVSLVPLRRRLKAAVPLLRHGQTLHDALPPKMPAYIGPLLAAGEGSGCLDAALGRIASILDRELDHALKRLTALIEPVMMLGMGGAVGSIALSIMMPIYDISKALQH